MFEFGSDSRSEAGRKGINNKGMVAYDRTLKKDVFYFYKSVTLILSWLCAYSFT